MATHSSVVAWRIPGTGEPGGLPSMGLHRVGHDWSDLAAAAAMCLGFPAGASDKEPPANAGDMRCRFHPWDGKIPWRREWQPTPVFLPGESHGWGAWRATVHEFAQLHPVQTWLKQLSRHACILCVYCHYYHEPLGKGIKANMIDNGAEDSLSNIKYNTTWVIDQAWLIMTWLMWSMSWFQECVTWTVLDILH